VTRATDPVGRVATNTYAANGIDPLEVRQVNGQTTDLLSSFTYNSQDEPQTVTDAAGPTWASAGTSTTAQSTDDVHGGGARWCSWPKARIVRPSITKEGCMLRWSLALPIVLVVIAKGGSSSAAATGGASSGLLLVANKGDHTLGLIDPDAGRQIATIDESGVTGHEVIASPDGRTAYVPIYGNSGVGKPGSDGQTLDVIDVASRKRVATIDFGRAERPHCPLFGPDGRLYVTTEITSTITVIDPHTNKVVDHIPTEQPESHMLALTRDGKRAYTSNVGVGTVSAIDLVTKKVTKVIPIAAHAQRISLSKDDRWVFTSDTTAPRMAVIDTSRNEVARWVTLPGLGYGSASTPDGRWLLIAIMDANKVGVIDVEKMELVRTLDVPKAPQEVVVRPDGRFAYVSCDASHQVAVLDLKEWKVDRLIDAGAQADGLAWAPVPTR
jgi:YVTN family beta-propeller protein